MFGAVLCCIAQQRLNAMTFFHSIFLHSFLNAFTKVTSYVISLGQRRKIQGCRENGNVILEMGKLKNSFFINILRDITGEASESKILCDNKYFGLLQ